MKTILLLFCGALLFGDAGIAAAKPHAVTFGKWNAIEWLAGENEDRPIKLRVRSLLVDGQMKAYVIGAPRQVTEETFVVQRMFRLNDSMPQEAGTRWRWERGGWLLVNRATGKIQALELPEFDAYNSAIAWFRDYAAYCGISEDGKKLIALVAQIGRRKPILKKPVGEFAGAEAPDSACAAPIWERAPTRVIFQGENEQKFMYTVRSRAIDLVPDEEESGEE